MSGSASRADVVPACLSFLAIYNPSLSDSDESVHDQIVYYYTKDQHLRKERKTNGGIEAEESRDELNEKLRQVGLAQGMVQFARDFASGEPVDAIETEKSRIILRNLESGWWLLASIDLTRIPSPPEVQAKNEAQSADISVEYSAREVALPALLLQQILSAHKIFLLHQAPSLSDLWDRLPRHKFCGFLKRFWDPFVWSWDVLLHGNPAVDIYNGLKLSAGGELGIGVGEEEWGSGEREVLEGFIGRTEGLVDLVVSRFGDATPKSSGSKMENQTPKGCGAGEHPGPNDGVIFSGIGALTRPSIRDISSWMEWLYMHGETAYGVRDNPSSSLRRKRRKPDRARQTKDQKASGEDVPIGIPAPIVPPPISQRKKSTNTSSSTSDAASPGKQEHLLKESTGGDAVIGTETFVKYLTLGVYGSQWGIPSGRPPTNQRLSSLRRDGSQPGKSQPAKYDGFVPNEQLSKGHYMVGLLGELEEDTRDDVLVQDTEEETDREPSESQPYSSRIVMRTIHVERKKTSPREFQGASQNNADEIYVDRLRVVVYVQQPFMFTFIFEMQTDALAMPSFYRSLHHQLGPLQRPLLTSTSPNKVFERLWEAASPRSTDSRPSTQPISDLVYDPSRLTVHTTIPNIPEPVPSPGAASAATWTRAEAMTVHSQILNTYTSTRRHSSELERTCKTSRGWWVVWMRLPHAPTTSQTHSSSYREAFLIRKASDYVAPAARKASGRFGRDVSGSHESAGWGPGKLAEGIGIDARQYIEGLLSLNR